MGNIFGTSESSIAEILGVAKTSLSEFLGMTLTSSATIYFEQNFDTEADWDATDWSPKYNFESCLFGYTDNKITANNINTTGGVSGRCHQIPIFGLTGDQTNFDIHFGKQLDPDLTEFYVRFYLKISANFNTDPGANWKLTYNYTDTAGFVFWMRPATSAGFQPAFYKAAAPETDLFKTESVDTFFFANYKNQWVCFEYYVNHSTNTIKLWITTPDNLSAYNETLYIDSNSFSNDGTDYQQIKFGAYWDGAEQADNYIWIDEIVVSDSYIGPL